MSSRSLLGDYGGTNLQGRWTGRRDCRKVADFRTKKKSLEVYAVGAVRRTQYWFFFFVSAGQAVFRRFATAQRLGALRGGVRQCTNEGQLRQGGWGETTVHGLVSSPSLSQPSLKENGWVGLQAFSGKVGLKACIHELLEAIRRRSFLVRSRPIAAHDDSQAELARC